MKTKQQAINRRTARKFARLMKRAQTADNAPGTQNAQGFAYAGR